MSGGAQAGPLSDSDRRRFRAWLRRIPKEQGRLERLGRAIIRTWCRLVGWRLDVEIHGDLPASDGHPRGAGCVIAAAPHRAWIEPFLLLAAWPPDAARLVWLADGRTVAGSRWRRHLLPRIGVIPIQGDYAGPRAYAQLASEALAAGAAIAIFPEKGPPSDADRTRAISPGFAYIARLAGAPIVPVVFGGTHHIVRGSRFSVHVLEAIDVGDADPDAFTPARRVFTRELVRHYESVMSDELPARNALTDAQRPQRDRWTWLGTLFR